MVGQHIESKFKDKNVWVPTKDRGLDLLVTNKSNKRALGVQVKFSRDFLPLMKLDPSATKALRSCTWFTLERAKIAQSTADIWVLVLLGFAKSTYDFVIIPPRELLKKLEQLHPRLERYQTYVWVTKRERAWLTRGVSKEEQLKITANTYDHELRDLSPELNNWNRIEQL